MLKHICIVYFFIFIVLSFNQLGLGLKGFTIIHPKLKSSMRNNYGEKPKFAKINHTNLFMTVRDSYEEKIKAIEKEYNALENVKEEENSTKKDLRIILDCIDALKQIDRDLLIFEEHMKGDDDSLKATAATFTKEFNDVKEKLEQHLKSLLFGN